MLPWLSRASSAVHTPAALSRAWRLASVHVGRVRVRVRVRVGVSVRVRIRVRVRVKGMVRVGVDARVRVRVVRLGLFRCAPVQSAARERECSSSSPG